MKTKLGITLSVLLAFSTPVLADPFVVKINNQFGFIDETGKLVIPAKYDDTNSFSDGLAVVKINSKWGFINKSGELVIPAKYDNAYVFSDGLASVKINDENVIINKSGKVIFNITKEEKQQAK